MLKLYNTKTREIQEFKASDNNNVSVYTCGPTVYWFAHIGNLRTYIFEDILKRVLIFNGYDVEHVMNITDVGHLTSDSDTGEDKLEKGAKREGKTVWEIAKFYTDAFLKDIDTLNIIRPDILIKATDTIKEQIDLISDLEKKGYTYKIDDGIYFDTSKLPSYGKLWPNKMDIKAGARVEMAEGKKNETDFALWKFSPKDSKREMEWESPWGIGFPGWHTECVAMSMMHFKIPLDIHCGGIDHVLIHHTNEIAQCEALTGNDLANFWMHGEYLILKDGKMAKSDGNIILINDIKEKFKYGAMAFRYLCLMTHYRKTLSFSWDSLTAAHNAYASIVSKISGLKRNQNNDLTSEESKQLKQEFIDCINDDLNTPEAIAVLQKTLSSEIDDNDKYLLTLEFDNVLGLNFNKIKSIWDMAIPQEALDKFQEYKNYKLEKDYTQSDRIRSELLEQGYQISKDDSGIISDVSSFDPFE